jgi:hypothetical protein
MPTFLQILDRHFYLIAQPLPLLHDKTADYQAAWNSIHRFQDNYLCIILATDLGALVQGYG